MWQPAYVKQLVTERYKNHPLFAGRSFSEWSKKLMNRDTPAHSAGKTHTTYFSLEHTPTTGSEQEPHRPLVVGRMREGGGKSIRQACTPSAPPRLQPG